MRVNCPYCGDRSLAEFVQRGEVTLARPNNEESFFDYVYLRANIAGVTTEYWYHAQGCRQWLRVTRNTMSHAIEKVTLAAEPNQ